MKHLSPLERSLCNKLGAVLKCYLRVVDLPHGFNLEGDRVAVVQERVGLWRLVVELEDERIFGNGNGLFRRNTDRRLVQADRAVSDPLVFV